PCQTRYRLRFPFRLGSCRLDDLALIVGHQIFQSFANGNFRFEAGQGTKFAAVADLNGNIDGTNELGINFLLQSARQTGHFDELIEQLTYGKHFVASDVVSLAGNTFVHQKNVRAGDVAHVHDDAFAGERADFDHRLLKSFKDTNDLVDVGGDGEAAA